MQARLCLPAINLRTRIAEMRPSAWSSSTEAITTGTSTAGFRRCVKWA